MNANQQFDHSSWTQTRVAHCGSLPQAVEALAVKSQYDRDQQIYHQDAEVDCWYRIIAGAARRFTVQPDGKRQIIDLLLPGDFFGFGVAGRHAFMAETIAPTVLARYPTSRIDSLIASNPRVGWELCGTVLTAVARLHSLVLILGRTTAEEKVGAFLMHMQARVGSAGERPLALPVTRYDIADFLALSVETVSRAVTGLKRRGAIELSRPRQIGIVDKEALAGEHEPIGRRAAAPPITDRCEPKRSTDRCEPKRSEELRRTQPVEICIPGHVFADTLADMRRWLDHQGYDPSRFTCVRDGSGAVVVRVEFSNNAERLAKAFEQQFAVRSGRGTQRIGLGETASPKRCELAAANGRSGQRF